ncbi:MAG TPA: GAF domain-containing protein [Terriglobales bacterium]|nr:GAF domain-containing protein [Terriglobales bacterium]
MSRQSAQPLNLTASDFAYGRNQEEIEIGQIEKELNDNRDQPLSSVLKGVIERARSLTDAEGAFIGVSDAWGVVCRASAGKAPDVGSKLPSEPTLTRKCMESGQVVTFEEDGEEDFRAGLAAPRWRLRSMVAVPVEGQGSVLGVVEVLSSRAAAFSPRHIAALQHIAHLLVPILRPEQPEQPRTRRKTARTWTAISGAGAALFLFSLLLWFESYRWPRNAPTATSNPPVSSASNPATAPTASGSMATPATDDRQSPEISDHHEVPAPPPAASSSSPPVVSPSATPSVAASALKPSPEVPRTTGRTTAAATSLPPAKANPPAPARPTMPPPVRMPTHNLPPSPASMATVNPQSAKPESGAPTSAVAATAPSMSMPTSPQPAASSPTADRSADRRQPELSTNGDVHVQPATAGSGSTEPPEDVAELNGNVPLGTYFEVGRFKDEPEADKVANRVAQAGFHPTVVPRAQFWAKFYHVLAGPFGTENEAEAARAKLESDGFTPRPVPKESKTLLLLSRTSSTGSRTLRLGDFEVAWESDSPDAIVRFVKGGTVVATAKAKWVSRQIPYQHDEIVCRGTGQGSRTLLEIHFAGTSQAVVIADKAQPIVF